MASVHDKNETINSKLGVSDERADELQSLLVAEMVVDFRRQKREGEVELNEGYESCKGAENALRSATTQQEAFVVGMMWNQLNDKINSPYSGGPEEFVNSFDFITDEDTVETASPKVLKELQDTKN